MKKLLALLLAIFMILPLVPIMAFAEGEPTVSMTVGIEGATAHPGDTITVPVVITQNDGLMGFLLAVEYDTDRLEVDTTKTLYTDGGLVSGVVYAENASYASTKGFTSTGTLFYLNFKVKEDAPTGAAAVTVKIIGSAEDNFYNDDLAPVTLDLTAHSITVEYETAGLTFVNGSQTMTYDEAKADAEGANTLTKPGDDYHFVGWFTGLADSYKDANGYYVVESTETVTSIAGTELRPRYASAEDVPTVGIYNALWIKGTGSYAVNVGEDSLDVYVDLTDNAVLTAAINGSNNQRTKLVKNMTLTAPITTTATMYLDMNGCTITAKANSILKLGACGNTAESSRVGGGFDGGKSKCFDTPKDSDYNYYGGQFDLMRDISLLGAKGSEVIILKSLTKIERCTLVGYIKILDSEATTLIDNCVITTSGFVLNTTGAVTITNTDITTTTTSSVPFLGEGSLYLGAGNTLIAKTAQYLFLNLKKVEFTSVERCDYQVAKTTVLAKTLNEYTTPVTFPTGLSYSIDDNGKIVFGEPCEVKYMADGVVQKTLYAMKGGYADLSVEHKFGDGTQYKLVGWTTDPAAKIPMTEVLLSGDTILYAVKAEMPTNIGGHVIENNITEFGSSTSLVFSNAHKLGELEQLVLTQNSGGARLTLNAAVLDSIAANAGSGSMDVNIDYKTVTEEGIIARLNVSLKKDEQDVIFNGAVTVKLRLGRSANVSGRNYRVYYIPEEGEPVAMATNIVDDGGNVYAIFTTTHFSTFEVRQTNVANGYTAALDILETEVRAGGNKINVGIDVTHSDKSKYNAGEIKLRFDPTLLTFVEADSTLPENATCKVENGVLTIEFFGDELVFPHKINLVFTTCASVNDQTSATVTLTGAKFADSEEALKDNLTVATCEPAFDTVTIKFEEFAVSLPLDKDASGDETVVKGEDYTFEVNEDPHYTYVVNATMGGQTVTLKDNGDGTYTIEGVTADIVVTIVKTANQYDVTFEGETPAVNDGNKATHDTDYHFTLPTIAQHQVNYTITIGGVEYTSAAVKDNVITIPGADITGVIVVTITKTQTEFNVNISGEGVIWTDDNGGVLKAGDSITVTITPAHGYNYSVTAKDASGNDVDVTDNGNNTYTIANVQSDITVTVTKTLAGTVKVEGNYIQLNNEVMYLVTYTGDLAEGYIPYYNDQPMYWSENYGAYCYLIISATELVQADVTAQVSVKAGTKTAINYSGNVNGSTDTDAADAQLVYDMYVVKYTDFVTVSMEKFLRADVNNDKKVDTTDAAYIINGILNPTTTEG